MTRLTHSLESSSRSLWALAAFGLPVSSALALGLGVGMMSWAGCPHVEPCLGSIGASVATLMFGGLAGSLGVNVWRARRAQALTDKISVDVEDERRLQGVEQLAQRFGLKTPALRVVALNSPLAFTLLARRPSIVVSTWVLQTLTDDEWNALVAHEMAHMRHGDRWVRWLGAWLYGAVQRVPGARVAWQRIDAASEDAADHAAVTVLGDSRALRSARAKFLKVTPSAVAIEVSEAIAPWPLSRHLALAALSVVLSLPALPFVVVPVCAAACANETPGT